MIHEGFCEKEYFLLIISSMEIGKIKPCSENSSKSPRINLYLIVIITSFLFYCRSTRLAATGFLKCTTSKEQATRKLIASRRSKTMWVNLSTSSSKTTESFNSFLSDSAMLRLSARGVNEISFDFKGFFFRGVLKRPLRNFFHPPRVVNLEDS